MSECEAQNLLHANADTRMDSQVSRYTARCQAGSFRRRRCHVIIPLPHRLAIRCHPSRDVLAAVTEHMWIGRDNTLSVTYLRCDSVHIVVNLLLH